MHGNEISSTDAGLLTAYHLAAAQNDELVEQILDQSVVIIDPMQNPDGRDRFINYFRQTRGPQPDQDPPLKVKIKVNYPLHARPRLDNLDETITLKAELFWGGKKQGSLSRTIEHVYDRTQE